MKIYVFILVYKCCCIDVGIETETKAQRGGRGDAGRWRRRGGAQCDVGALDGAKYAQKRCWQRWRRCGAVCGERGVGGVEQSEKGATTRCWGKFFFIFCFFFFFFVVRGIVVVRVIIRSIVRFVLIVVIVVVIKFSTPFQLSLVVFLLRSFCFIFEWIKQTCSSVTQRNNTAYFFFFSDNFETHSQCQAMKNYKTCAHKTPRKYFHLKR